MSTSRPATPAEWTLRLEADGTVEFPTDRRRAALMLAVCVGFTLAGVWIIRSGLSAGSPLGAVQVGAGGLAVLFFGVLVIPLGAARLLTNRPVVRVERAGIRWGNQSLRWSEVTDIWVWNADHPGKPAVVLQQTPEAAARNLDAQDVLWRGVTRFHHRLVCARANLLPTSNGFGAHQMARWLNELRHVALQR